MSNNRKYITSTGLLLKTLSEENQNQIYHHHNTDSLYNNNNKSQFSLNNNNQASLSPALIPDTNRFAKKQQNYFNTTNKPQQYQHQQQQQQHHHVLSSTTINYKTFPSKSSTYEQPSSSSSSSVAELPETFGLPLNKFKKTLPKFSTHNPQQNLLNSTNSDIQIISSQNKAAITSSNLSESISAPALTTSKQQQDNEIEIIGENYPSTSSSATSIQNKLILNKNQVIASSSTDEKFKEYLTKNYNTDLSVSCKPQCNFVSNISCIDQCIQQSNYFENYLKKQQGFNKRTKYNSFSSDNEDDNNQASNSISKIKKQKIIVINDTNEDCDEAHKPWITTQLINLIKQRNLLQSKLNVQGKEPDAELMAKFKNLRNKVTKLVKNARKEYLAKMVKEKKEKEAATTELQINSENSSKTIDQQSSSNSITTTQQQQSISSTSIAISANQSAYMLNLYNAFYNQYMQNYAQQKLPQSTNDTNGGEYDSLTQQATFYAKQQQSIQKQLETCLSSATQQYIKDLIP